MKTTDFFMKIEIENIDPITQQKVTISITPHVVMEHGDTYSEARDKVYEDGLQFIKAKIEALRMTVVEQKPITVIDSAPTTAKEALVLALTETENESIKTLEVVLGEMDIEWVKEPVVEEKPIESAVKKQSSFSKYVK